MTSDRQDCWAIKVVAEGDGPPVEIRIRRFLKLALRSFGLRCVSVEGDHCSRCQYLDGLVAAMASKLADASAVLGRAAERIDPKQRKALAGELRTVRRAADRERRRVVAGVEL